MSNTTKQDLEASLKKVMLQKPLDKITISDITSDCGISRMAFYYHFKDIYDLVEWSCLEDAKRALQGKKTYDLLKAVVEEKTAGMQIREEQKEFIANFYKYSFVGIMLDWIKQGMKEDRTTHCRDSLFFCYWIKQGMKEDYSEIVDNMALTLHGSITNSVQNFLSKTDP